ncbi:uncharacterized protein [Magallana gigas]|uniref:uncharacterized protein isoform X1 n=2 Tax=Magallana gigas TaxID=29159 RepID=UPI00333FE091
MALAGAAGGDGAPSPKKHKSSPFQAAQQKIYIMETPEIRKNPTDAKEYAVTNVLSTTTAFNTRHELYLTIKHLEKIKKSTGKCLLIRGFSQRDDHSIRITDTTIVMDTAMEKSISTEIIKKHIEPDILSIAEIKTKQKGDRVSVKGHVDKITNVLETKTSKRRIITLTDQSGSLDIKMWGSHVNKLTNQYDDVTIICLTVDLYMGRVSLNSNTSTTLQVMQQEQSIHGKIEAASFERNQMSIMINDIIYNLTEELMKRIFPEMNYIDNMRVSINVKGNSIVQINMVTAENDWELQLEQHE